MSQKKTKKQRAEQRRLVEKLTREDVYKKPPLAKLYDKFNPGDYTMRQDFYHTVFLFSFIVVVIGLIIAINWGMATNYEKEREAQLTIPAASFVKGQESNISDMLHGYGFKDIGITENGDVIAFGTTDMVKAYKDSYKEKNVDSILESFNDDMSADGIESMSLSDDGRTLTIGTYRNMAENPDDLDSLVATDKMNKVISVLSNWCGLRNDGEKLTTVFVNVFDTTSGTNGTKYWESTKATGDQMVAEREQEISEAQTEENEQAESGEDATGES